MSTVIEMKDITMSFGANEVLKGIDLALEAGKVTALLGANGAGKSTLIKVLSGVYDGYGGAVIIDSAAGLTSTTPRLPQVRHRSRPPEDRRRCGPRLERRRELPLRRHRQQQRVAGSLSPLTHAEGPQGGLGSRSQLVR